MAAFRVLKPFVLLRTRDGSKLDDGNKDLPILGEYHTGHDYAITDVNAEGVKQAMAKGLVR